MKRMYLSLLTAFAMVGLTSSITAMEILNPPVFLFNNSDKSIVYRLGYALGVTLGNGAKVELGSLRDISQWGLSIREAYGLPYNLAGTLEKVNNKIPLQGYHNAILTINPDLSVIVSFEPRGAKTDVSWPVNRTLPNTKVLPTKKQTVK